jgi:hypothetical protein
MIAIWFLFILLAGIIVVFLVRRRRPDLLRSLRTVSLAALLFCFADWAMLAALPVLKLSYGPVAPPTVMSNILRLGILLLTLPALSRAASARQRKIVAVLAGSIQAIIFIVAFYALYIEPFHLTVTELPLQSPAFLPDRPLRIVQLTDIHVEHLTRREKDMLAKVASLHPDIIVLTGDYINPNYASDPVTQQETRQIMSQLHAPYGVYAVSGTVESSALMSFFFDGLDNVRVLEDEILPLSLPGGTLYLVGVPTTDSLARDRQALASLMSGLPPDAYTLLLYHSPDLIETASASGIDLYLAGHTHGGQIRLPFYGAVITFSVYGKKYEMGNYIVGPTTLYVSRGIGMEGGPLPRARFLCPPEIVLVELGK